jgi:ribokinase
VMCQLEIPVDTVLAAARAARGTFILNTAPWTPLPQALLDEVDVLVANQTEIAQLVGAEPPATLDAATALLNGLGFDGTVIVTVGAQGAVVYDGRSRGVHAIAAPSVTVMDTTGAGDCFCGVLAARLADGDTVLDAAGSAVIGASLSTQGIGARGYLPTFQQIQDVIDG